MMSDDEICREYRLSKNKWEMIQILAELNMETRLDILSILLSNGEDVVKPVKRKDGKCLEKGKMYYRMLQERLDRLDERIAKAEAEYRETALLLKAGKIEGKG